MLHHGICTGIDRGLCACAQAIGKQADSSWLFVVPWGLRKVLAYVDKRYSHPDIWITESGVDVPGEYEAPFPAVLEDTFRIEYFQVCGLRCREHARSFSWCYFISLLPLLSLSVRFHLP